jgi:hypothetical protein
MALESVSPYSLSERLFPMDLSIVSSLGDGISTLLHGVWQGFKQLIDAVGGSAADLENAIGSGEHNQETSGSIADVIGSAGSSN